MLDWDLLQRLMGCFPNSFINQQGEFIAHLKANQYFILRDCKSEIDIKCKVLEWFSRGAYKTEPYGSEKKNNEFHKFMRDGINEFLGTDFDDEDMEVIYTYLGNCCHHNLTIQFIQNGFDFSLLRR